MRGARTPLVVETYTHISTN